jgi:hypothetical protein
MPMPTTSSFFDALCAKGPASDRADRMQLYGFLVGQWKMDAVYHLDDGSIRRSRGEIHAAWVLAGRAIQDVWIVPARDGAAESPPDGGAFYGTTLRIYDPGLDAWHIVWSDPVRQFYGRQTGRAQGRDIVQEGTASDGTKIRWSFSDITADSFHWRGERWDEAAGAWRLRTEYFARRVGGAEEPGARSQ